MHFQPIQDGAGIPGFILWLPTPQVLLKTFHSSSYLSLKIISLPLTCRTRIYPIFYLFSKSISKSSKHKIRGIGNLQRSLAAPVSCMRAQHATKCRMPIGRSTMEGETTANQLLAPMHNTQSVFQRWQHPAVVVLDASRASIFVNDPKYRMQAVPLFNHFWHKCAIQRIPEAITR